MAAAPDGAEHGFRSIATVLARRDVARVLQVRLAADGTLRLRAYRVGSEAPAELRGPWQVGAESDPAASAAALGALGRALEGVALRPERPAAEPGVDTRVRIDRIEAARLVIDAEDGVPWRHVQWVLAVGSRPAPGLRHITFLAPPHGARLDLDLPGDPWLKGWVADVPLHEDLPAVKLFRKEGTPSPAADFTRVRLGDEQTWDLPPAYGEATEVALGALRNILAARIKQAASEKPPRIEVKAPPPTGGRVPTGDVLRVLDAIRRAGIEAILLEGTPLPVASPGDSPSR